MASLESPGRRPRPKSRVMSFGSRRSEDDQGRARIDLTETARDKARNRMTMETKADPRKAISEKEPGEVQFEKSTLESIRTIAHRDFDGNLITDPDRSNPTRPRMERPLDTIRSFEAACDGVYNRRQSSRPEQHDMGYASRRSSYHQGYGSMTPQPRFQDDGYGRSYGRGSPGMGRESYVNGYGHGYRSSHSPAPLREMRRPPPRNTSDPALYGSNAHHFYGQSQQSYETATTGSGSGHSYGTEPWTNSTDPSSENSSIDRLQQHAVPPPPPKHTEASEQHGFSGFGGAPDLQQMPIAEEGYGYDERYASQYDAQHYQSSTRDQGYATQMDYGQNDYGAPAHTAYGGGGNMAPPPPPHTDKPQPLRNPSKLRSARRPVPTNAAPAQYDGYGAPVVSESAEKRKSWLKRRFSKN